MKPDFDRAATKATETLINNHISSAPVFPLPILKRMPGVFVVSFAEMSELSGLERNKLVAMFGETQDATTFHLPDGKFQYVIAYNMRLPQYLIQRALARELGHIVLGHDGSRPDEVRNAEAYCFAHHLLCPRPLIRAVQESGIRFSIEVLGSITGCYERCLAAIRKEPNAHVPAELNRAVRDQFADYMKDFLEFMPFIAGDDDSPVADFGHYMDGYEE